MNELSLEAIQKKAEKRREVNRKYNLLKDSGFIAQETRFVHPSGKIIMRQMYDKMNYEALVSRLATLGFHLGSFNKAN